MIMSVHREQRYLCEQLYDIQSKICTSKDISFKSFYILKYYIYYSYIKGSMFK